MTHVLNCVCVCVCVCVCTYVHFVCVCVCVYIYIYMFIYLFIYLYLYTQCIFLLMYVITLKCAALELVAYSFSIGTVNGFLVYSLHTRAVTMYTEWPKIMYTHFDMKNITV